MTEPRPAARPAAAAPRPAAPRPAARLARTSRDAPAPRVAETNAAIERAYRDAYGSVLATLIRFLGGDFDAAEEALSDAFAAALETWPRDGIPANSAAWLTTAARNRALDRIRRDRRGAEKLALLEGELAATEVSPMQLGSEGGFDDDRLRLIFTCCHPALPLDARVALTLRTLGGLTTPEIARAFLVPEATLAQRLVRAKRKIKLAAIPYRVPLGEELPERLDSVLATLYLVFNEGYLATSGDAAVRRELCAEAIRLASIVADLMTDRPETNGLLALLLLQDSRRDALVGPDGSIALLEDQDRRQWDRAEIGRGFEALDRGFAAAARRTHASIGRYLLQASIAAEHARTVDGRPTDWLSIATLYEALARLDPSPIVELNRAVAVAQADGPPRRSPPAGRSRGERRAGRLSPPAGRAGRLPAPPGPAPGSRHRIRASAGPVRQRRRAPLPRAAAGRNEELESSVPSFVSSLAGWPRRISSATALATGGGFVFVTQSWTAQPENQWRQAEKIGLLAWAIAIIGVSAAGNQWALSQEHLPTDIELIAVVLFLIGVPLVFGAVAGSLIRRDGPWRDLLLMAAVGAACIALALYVQWVEDPRTCMPDPGTDCDTGFSVGATLIFGVCYLPFLAGSAAGKASTTTRRPRLAPIAPWTAIAERSWRWFSRTFRSASPAMKVALAVSLIWATTVYVFVGPLVLDEVYWLLGKVARVQRHARLRLGTAVASAMAYLAAITFLGSMQHLYVGVLR